MRKYTTGVTIEGNEVKFEITNNKLFCYYEDLKSLDLSGLDKLEELYCYANKITELDFSDCKNLRIIECHDNLLIKIDISMCHKLQHIWASREKIDVLCSDEYCNYQINEILEEIQDYKEQIKRLRKEIKSLKK